MADLETDTVVSDVQLDLFAEPARPLLPMRKADLAAPTKERVAAFPDQRLVDFVLGGSRSRGRPFHAPQPQSGMVEIKRLLDVREAARRLGLSKSTLDKMRCSGRGPRYIKATDRAIRYDPADLEAFAADRRRRSTSEDAVAMLGA